MRLLPLIYSDYIAHYRGRQESPGRLATLAVPRILTNACLHATILIRICLMGPRPLFFIWRNILITKHSIDVGADCTIGPGFNLPHPFGIVLGSGVVLGDDVLLYHNVTLGTARAPRAGEHLGVPTLGNHIVIHPGSVIAGDVKIGDHCVIGANSFVNSDLKPGTIYRRRADSSHLDRARPG